MTPQRRAGLIATQVLGLALCRYVLRLPPVVGMSRDEIVSLARADSSAISGSTGIIEGDVDSDARPDRHHHARGLCHARWRPLRIPRHRPVLAQAPGIIQSRNGGVSRARFWIPAHVAFEVLLVVSLIAAWNHARSAGGAAASRSSATLRCGCGRLSTSSQRHWRSRRPTPRGLTRPPRSGGPVAACCGCPWTVLTCSAMLAALAVA